MEERVLRVLSDELRRGRLVVFVGSDLPASVSGVPANRDLARELIERYKLPVSKSRMSFPSVAQFMDSEGHRHILIGFLQEKLAGLQGPGLFDLLLAELPINTYITTRYDHLLQEALRKRRGRVNLVVDDEHISSLLPNDPTLVQPYGRVYPLSHRLFLAEDELSSTLWEQKPGVRNMVERIFRNNTVLLIGLDLDTPAYFKPFLSIWRGILQQLGRDAPRAYMITQQDVSKAHQAIWEGRNIEVLRDNPQAVIQALVEQSRIAKGASEEVSQQPRKRKTKKVSPRERRRWEKEIDWSDWMDVLIGSLSLLMNAYLYWAQIRPLLDTVWRVVFFLGIASIIVAVMIKVFRFFSESWFVRGVLMVLITWGLLRLLPSPAQGSLMPTATPTAILKPGPVAPEVSLNMLEPVPTETSTATLEPELVIPEVFPNMLEPLPIGSFEVLQAGVRLRAAPSIKARIVGKVGPSFILSVSGSDEPVWDEEAKMRWWPVLSPYDGTVVWVAEYDWTGTTTRDLLIKPRIDVGQYAWIVNPDEGGQVNLRKEDCKDRVAVLSRGTRVWVEGGPSLKCYEKTLRMAQLGRRWWKVRVVELDKEGWIADFSESTRAPLLGPLWYLERSQRLPPWPSRR